MINVSGILVESVQVWGWPWHGVLRRDEVNPAQFYLLRHDGAQWPMQGEHGPYISAATLDSWADRTAAANSLTNTQFESGSIGTHMVRVDGHLWPGRTPEQQAQDIAGSQEWCGAAMITDGHIYGRQLGGFAGILRWIYSKDSEVWLLEARVIGNVPAPGRNATLPLRLRFFARRFGLVGVPDQWQQVGESQAPTCVPQPPGVTTNGEPIVHAQSIRSDGGHLIVEVAGPGEGPARFQRGAYGFYDLDVSRVGGAWVFGLSLRLAAHQIYTRQLIQNDLRPASNWIGPVIIEDIPPNSTRFTTNVLAEAVPDNNTTACTGVVEQVQTRHCGWVYDEDDVLHEVVCRIRVRHDCNVDRLRPEFTGSRLVTTLPDGSVDIQDDSLLVYQNETEVTTTVTSEMLRNGNIVSSCSAETYSRKKWQDGTQSGVAYQSAVEYFWRVTVGDYVTSSTNTIATLWPDWQSGNQGRLWPVVGILNGFFSTMQAGASRTILPWNNSPGLRAVGTVFRQQLEDNRAGAFTGPLPTFKVGACRLANNVWLPFAQAGFELPGLPLRWVQITANSNVQPSEVQGLPPTVYGQLVGPKNGPAPLGWSLASSIRLAPPPGTYDYLHGITLPYGHVV